ncbi:hypothetical protein TSST111916_13785 [Tsukamurella strandjordii]
MKAGLTLTGIAAGHPRRPLLPLDDAEAEELSRLLTAAGVG